MKCPNPDCGWSGDGTFCPECGRKLNSEELGVCKGKLEDVSSCGATLRPNEIFCRNCGTRVDATLSPVILKCSQCGNALQNNDIFCSKCGTRNGDIPGKCCY